MAPNISRAYGAKRSDYTTHHITPKSISRRPLGVTQEVLKGIQTAVDVRNLLRGCHRDVLHRPALRRRRRLSRRSLHSLVRVLLQFFLHFLKCPTRRRLAFPCIRSRGAGAKALNAVHLPVLHALCPVRHPGHGWSPCRSSRRGVETVRSACRQRSRAGRVGGCTTCSAGPSRQSPARCSVGLRVAQRTAAARRCAAARRR